MDMPRRFPCPVCEGKGFLWGSRVKGVSALRRWQVSDCYECKGYKVVLVDKDGWLIGPDAPPRYLCDHGEKLTDKCEQCHPVPHAILLTDEDIFKEVLNGT